ncbi:hypothetical protein Taro_041700, partial [Colocasia esculenta]|nr:hypothetical protein [Colocasia esculenta]
MSHHDPQSLSAYSLLPDVVFRDEDDDEEGEEEDARDHDSDCGVGVGGGEATSIHLSGGIGGDQAALPQARIPYIDPEPYISSQFYTFNRESHALMARCILEGRLANAEEIRRATPPAVLESWRSVWKDRNEDTAYLTAWKRIQDKLGAHRDTRRGGGAAFIYFKNNASQCVSHVEQWQDIVTSFHGDADLRHLGLKDTIDRIKQVWTVGAKFYGIPESFIRACVASCPVCTDGGPASNGAGRTKRRRFEYTESFDLPARDVPTRLQQLAAKHKVVLCIRQKYIRYKPFMAEVKDYACHRAGEPSSSAAAGAKKSKVLKREPYASKRCGCGFRIRAIVPIANYNEKDKTFVYQEEGTAVFKLYAVHTGHEPGPLDGNARIIHRMLGYKGSFDQDPVVYGVSEDTEPESYVQELRVEVHALEEKVMKVPRGLLTSLSQELSDILTRIRNARAGTILDKLQHSEEVLVVGDGDLGHWEDDHQSQRDRIYDKDVELIEEEDAIFGRSLGHIVPWDRIRDECESTKVVMRESCKPDKWLFKEDCGEFDEKSILCSRVEEDSKMIKPINHDGAMVVLFPGLLTS